jgi:hypothetical protein
VEERKADYNAQHVTLPSHLRRITSVELTKINKVPEKLGNSDSHAYVLCNIDSYESHDSTNRTNGHMLLFHLMPTAMDLRYYSSLPSQPGLIG